MIDSPANPKIRFAQAVRSGQHRELVLLEGERGVLEAASHGLPFELLLATPETAGILDRSLPGHQSLTPLATNAKLLATLSDLDAPRDVIAVVRNPRPDAAQFSLSGDHRLLVYADRVQDPVNLGALARVCAAVGADALLTSPGSVHPNHHRAVRASAFSLLTLPVYPKLPWQQLRLLTQDANWIALDPRAKQGIYDCPVNSPLVAVIGGEMGISPEHLTQVPAAAIPMSGEVESLNLAVAAGVALFDWVRRL